MRSLLVAGGVAVAGTALGTLAYTVVSSPAQGTGTTEPSATAPASADQTVVHVRRPAGGNSASRVDDSGHHSGYHDSGHHSGYDDRGHDDSGYDDSGHHSDDDDRGYDDSGHHSGSDDSGHHSGSDDSGHHSGDSGDDDRGDDDSGHDSDDD